MPRGRGLGGDTFCAVLSDGPAGRRLGGNGESHLALDILMLLSCSLSCLLRALSNDSDSGSWGRGAVSVGVVALKVPTQPPEGSSEEGGLVGG